MKNWLLQSFFRQISLAIVLFSVAAIFLYAYQNYVNVRRQWHVTLESQATNVAALSALMVSDDLRYGKYFDLWSKLANLKDQSRSAGKGGLYFLDEIAVLDNSGNVAGSTDPQRHPLLKPYDGIVPKFPGKISWPADAAGRVRIAEPVLFGGEKIGSLVMAFDVTPFRLFIRKHLTHFVAYVVAIMLATGAFGLVLARWITTPLENLRAVLPLLGSGGASVPAVASRRDEYGLLGRAIEAADKRIRENDEQIRMHQDHLEEMVRQRTRELEAANSELEAFSYSVSHDLRAPLRSIDGFSLALVEDYGDKLDGSAMGYLKRVRGAAQKMGMLIDDMLQLSRVTRTELAHADVDLSVMAEQIVSGLRASEPGREVGVSIESGLIAMGDAGLFYIMLQNFLGNAWKFTKGKSDAFIEFGSMRQDGERVLFVRDNGAGFDMRYASKLFGAFQRLHTEDEFPGTGIGLATVQRIVNRHGGRVWAEGEVKKGACFYFVLK